MLGLARHFVSYKTVFLLDSTCSFKAWGHLLQLPLAFLESFQYTKAESNLMFDEVVVKRSIVLNQDHLYLSKHVNKTGPFSHNLLLPEEDRNRVTLLS